MTFPEKKTEVDESTKEGEVDRPRAGQESVRQQAYSVESPNILLLNPSNRRRRLGNTTSNQARSKLFSRINNFHREQVENELQSDRLRKM